MDLKDKDPSFINEVIMPLLLIISLSTVGYIAQQSHINQQNNHQTNNTMENEHQELIETPAKKSRGSSNIFNFRKSNQMSRPTKYDPLVAQFPNPGDTLSWPEEDVSPATASTIRARMMQLLPGVVFHSGYNESDKETFVRRRPDGEVPARDTEGQQEEE